MTGEDFNDKNKESDSDKDFGLPKVEITPIQPKGKPEGPSKSKEMAPGSGQGPLKTSGSEAKTGKSEANPEKRNKRNKGLWIIWLLVFLILGLGAWFYFNDSQDEPSVQEPIVEEEIEIPQPSEPEQTPNEVPEEPVEEITLTEITSRADLPRYFVVVGSFIDQDLARDYSQELNRKGLNTFLIHPYGEISFFRLAIGHFESFNLAVKEMNRVKADFNENLWVLKY